MRPRRPATASALVQEGLTGPASGQSLRWTPQQVVAPSPELHLSPLEEDEGRRAETLARRSARFDVPQSRGEGCFGREVLD